jgi:hypothetical protein
MLCPQKRLRISFGILMSFGLTSCGIFGSGASSIDYHANGYINYGATYYYIGGQGTTLYQVLTFDPDGTGDYYEWSVSDTITYSHAFTYTIKKTINVSMSGLGAISGGYFDKATTGNIFVVSASEIYQKGKYFDGTIKTSSSK